MLIKAISNHQTHQSCHDWKDRLKWGDVILFPFPTEATRQRLDQEPRPCLVQDIRCISGVRFATLICGSKRETKCKSSLQTYISNPLALVAAGLRSPTAFNSNLRITVSLDHDGFKSNGAASPVIGRLIDQDRLHFNAVRARVQVNIDMAAARYLENSLKKGTHKKPTLPSISLTKTATEAPPTI